MIFFRIKMVINYPDAKTHQGGEQYPMTDKQLKEAKEKAAKEEKGRKFRDFAEGLYNAIVCGPG